MRANRILSIFSQNWLRRLTATRRENGAGLAEVLIALAITGTIVVVFLSSLSTGARAVGVIYERTTAQNLARSQLEYTRSQDYVPAPASYEPIPSLPPDFTVSVQASAVEDRDDNIQKITVTVYRNGESILVMEDFKVNR